MAAREVTIAQVQLCTPMFSGFSYTLFKKRRLKIMKTMTLNSRVSASVATCPTQQLPEVYRILQEPRVSSGALSEPRLAYIICALLLQPNALLRTWTIGPRGIIYYEVRLQRALLSTCRMGTGQVLQTARHSHPAPSFFPSLCPSQLAHAYTHTH